MKNDSGCLMDSNGKAAAAGELRYSVVVPVFNEAANIAAFCRGALADLPGGYELLICYDTPEDSTLAALESLPPDEKPKQIRLIHNQLGRGVRYAIEAGFRAAQSPLILVCMVDLSDDLSSVPAMLALADSGAAVVCGSRYMRGGRQIGGPWLKSLLSRMAGLTLCWFTGLPTHDPTNSFKVYRKDFLDQQKIESSAGFCLGLELTVKAHFDGYRVEEVPTTWRDRTAGESRFRLWKWLPLYLTWYFFAFRARFHGVRRRTENALATSAVAETVVDRLSHPGSPGSIGTRIACAAMLLTPFLILLAYTLLFSVNAPALDDYDAILGFLSDFAPDHLWSALFDLGRFHNEHRIIVTRFLAWISLMLFGRVSFSGLVALANGLLVLLAFVLLRRARNSGLKSFWLVPIPCILLACQDPSNGLIAMFGLQNLAVQAFAGLAFACWAKHRWGAILFGVLAAGTSACGLLVLPIVFGFTISMNWKNADARSESQFVHPRRSTTPWMLVIAVTLWSLYFWGYATPQTHAPLMASMFAPAKIFTFAGALAAAPLRRFGDAWLPLLGLVEIGLGLLIIFRCNWRRHSLFVQFFAFELGTIFLISFSRSQLGIQPAFETRYRIVALALMMSLYAVSAQSFAARVPNRWGRGTAFVLAMLFLGCNLYTARGNFQGYMTMHQRMQRQLSEMPANPESLFYPDRRKAWQIAITAEKKGIFHWPATRN
jgi:hypothetical protein